MTNIEKKVMTFLVSVLFINSVLILAFYSSVLSFLLNLKPENILGTVIVFSLVGTHALFALFTMLLSLNGSRSIYRYYMLGFSAIVPVFFMLVNFRIIISYQTDSYYFLPISLLALCLYIKKSEQIQNWINLYVKTLVNPLDSSWY
jgi:hypothetical protein